MPLDPAVRAWLQQTEAEQPAPLETLTPEQARQQMLQGAASLGPSEAVAQVRPLQLPGPAGPLAARLYHPRPAEPCPAILYFHGGGWVLGNLDTHDGYCRALANATQMAVLAVDYRLAPEHPYPAAVEDCYAATCWAAEQAAELHIRGDQLAVAGDSAGGNLAAAVALAARDKGTPPIKLQVLIYPITDCDFETPSYRENATGYHLTRQAMIWFWNHYLTEPSLAAEPYASPLRAADLSGLPAALVLTAEYDPLRDEGDAYARRMDEAGVPVQWQCVEGVVHGFIPRLNSLPPAQDALKWISQRIRNHFAP